MNRRYFLQTKSKYLQWFLIIGIGLLSSSCKPLFLKLYGIKSYRTLDENTVKETAEKFHIPSDQLYVVLEDYRLFLKSFDTIFKHQIKNHYQPLQVIYYDSTGFMQSYHVNCYARGFPNLKWNASKAFDVFPPKQQAPLDTLVKLQDQVRFIQLQDQNWKENRYHVFVYWSCIMGRQSKRLIRLVQQKSNDLPFPIKIYYVNSDFLLSK